MVTGWKCRSKKGMILSGLLRWSVLCVLAFVAVRVPTALAQTIDPHRLYEQRCSGCHAPHGGGFVRDSLVFSDGKLLGRKSSRELRTFLEAGHGKLTADEIESLVTHLASIQQSGRLFQDKCAICHERAADFARSELVMKEGRLVGRYSDRDVEQFLAGHGRLQGDEVSKMVEVLKRQLDTAEAD